MKENDSELKLENAKLREYILDLTPYCSNCKYDCNYEDEDGWVPCDECNRKSFNWTHKEEIEI